MEVLVNNKIQTEQNQNKNACTYQENLQNNCKKRHRYKDLENNRAKKCRRYEQDLQKNRTKNVIDMKRI